jgi:hypothetical protein
LNLIFIYNCKYNSTRMPTISFSIGGEKHDISGKSGKEVVGMVVKEIKKKKLIVRKKKEDRPIEETNDNCSKCDIILTDDDMDSETGKCELCNEEEEEEVDMKTIDWVSKNAKFIDFSAEAMARSNEPDTEPESDTEDEDEDEEDMNMDTPNYKQKIEEACPVGHITVWGDHGFIYEVEEKIEKCEKCDIRLGTYDGTWEMKVDWFGKTMCGKCAYVKAERKEIK